jgi:hypothetical protein
MLTAFIALMQRAAGAGQQRRGGDSSAKPAHRPGTRRPRCSGRPRRRWSATSWGMSGRRSHPSSLAPARSPACWPRSLSESPLIPAQLLGAMANVAIDIALNAVSAVPWRDGSSASLSGSGKALAALSGAFARMTTSPEQRARLPWGRYNRDIDQEWVRTFIKIDAAGVDWTPMFAPPTDAIPWKLLDGVDQDDPKNVLGQVLAPSPTRPSPTTACTAACRAPSASRASCSTAPARSGPTRSCASTTTAPSSSSTATTRRPATSSPRCSSSPGPPGSRSPPAARTRTRSTA